MIPIVLAVNSRHVHPLYMTWAPPVGTVCAVVSWLVSTKIMYGAVNVTTTYENWPMFIGCMFGLFMPLLIWAAAYPFTSVYDWNLLFTMDAREPRPHDVTYAAEDVADLGDDWDPPALTKASHEAKIICLFMVLIFLVLIPFSLYGTGYIFSRNFFTGFIVIVFIWAWVAALVICLLPIWEARKLWIGIARGLVKGRRASTTTSVSEGVAVHAEKDTSSKGEVGEKTASL